MITPEAAYENGRQGLLKQGVCEQQFHTVLTFLVLGHQKGCSLLCMYGYPHALTLLPQFTTVHGSRGSIARILGKEVIRGGKYHL